MLVDPSSIFGFSGCFCTIFYNLSLLCNLKILLEALTEFRNSCSCPDLINFFKIILALELGFSLVLSVRCYMVTWEGEDKERVCKRISSQPVSATVKIS